jgi:hypothetical protein
VVEALEPVVTPVVETLEPVVTPVVETLAPVVAPVIEALEPAQGTAPAGVSTLVSEAADDYFHSSAQPSAEASLAPELTAQNEASLHPTSSAGSLSERLLRQPEAPGSSQSSSAWTSDVLVRISALFSTETTGPSTAGALSAVLAGLFVLLLTPALAARANVALPAPRSLSILPVHPPD